MNQLQREAIKTVEAEILFEANENAHDEYIVDGDYTFSRRPNGDIVAVDNGQYVLECRQDAEGTLHCTLITDYGFCKSECSYCEIDIHGNINFD
jgi:hypothetical protein